MKLYPKKYDPAIQSAKAAFAATARRAAHIIGTGALVLGGTITAGATGCDVITKSDIREKADACAAAHAARDGTLSPFFSAPPPRPGLCDHRAEEGIILKNKVRNGQLAGLLVIGAGLGLRRLGRRKQPSPA